MRKLYPLSKPTYPSETFVYRHDDYTRQLQKELQECKGKLRKFEDMATKFQEVGQISPLSA